METKKQPELQILPFPLSVCKLNTAEGLRPGAPFYFLGVTDEEISLVCPTRDVPAVTAAREDGWRGFRIRGTLDFSLVGILSRLSGILAENGIALFAVSTFNTDYILVRAEDFERALSLLTAAGYTAT